MFVNNGMELNLFALYHENIIDKDIIGIFPIPLTHNFS